MGMDRKRSHGFATPPTKAEVGEPYRYVRVEDALGAMMGADREQQQGALRGRLKKLSTLGLPPAGPGKGARRRYSLDQIYQLAIALLVEDAGVDPTAAVPALNNVWPAIARNVRRAPECKPENPMMITLRLETVAGPWRTRDPLSAMPWITVAPRIDERARARYRKHRFKDESDTVVMLIDRNQPGWVATRNLTDRLRVLLTALHSED
jgi:hypothetical protein